MKHKYIGVVLGLMIAASSTGCLPAYAASGNTKQTENSATEADTEKDDKIDTESGATKSEPDDAKDKESFADASDSTDKETEDKPSDHDQDNEQRMRPGFDKHGRNDFRERPDSNQAPGQTTPSSENSDSKDKDDETEKEEGEQKTGHETDDAQDKDVPAPNHSDERPFYGRGRHEMRDRMRPFPGQNTPSENEDAEQSDDSKNEKEQSNNDDSTEKNTEPKTGEKPDDSKNVVPDMNGYDQHMPDMGMPFGGWAERNHMPFGNDDPCNGMGRQRPDMTQPDMGRPNFGSQNGHKDGDMDDRPTNKSETKPREDNMM